MSSRMTQVKGIDTSVEQFRPSRANPVARRAIRKYYAQQPVTGTSIFENLTFQVEQTDPKNVINEIRMVFPLELKAYTIEDSGAKVAIEMHTNSWKRASNIAVAQNAPFSAFRNLEIAINGKVYSQRPQQYGKMLGQCFQSYSELQFQNDESLKPICNNFIGGKEKYVSHSVFDENNDETQHYVEINEFNPEPTTFSLLENNSGFIARARRFQDGLQDDGKTWRGEISSLFQGSIFNAEARRQGNDQIPFVSDLYVNCVFETNLDILDKKFTVDTMHDLQSYQRTIPQKLFEFLTPMTAAFPYENRLAPNQKYPSFFELQWTAQPRLEIEYVQYSQALLSPMYRLRGKRYQHEETLPFQVPFKHLPEEREWVSTSLRRQLLAVPNNIYVWVEPTLATVRNSFCWGGMFRTLDIRNFRCRVNGSVDIIQDPSDEILFKWYKRNTSNVFEFPTWCKNKVIVFSPSEVGLKTWLENQASVSTLDISLETTHSRLMTPEYARLSDFNDMSELGYQATSRPFTIAPTILNLPELYTEKSVPVRLAPYKHNLAARDRTAWLETQAWRSNEYVTDTHKSLFDIKTSFWMNNVFQNKTLRSYEHPVIGEFSVDRIMSLQTSWFDGFTWWIQVNILTHEFQRMNSSDKLQIWVTDETNLFEPVQRYLTDDGHMRTVGWEILLDPSFIDAGGDISAHFLGIDWTTQAQSQPQYTATAAKQVALWAQIDLAVESLECGARYQDGADNSVMMQRTPDFFLNVVNPNGDGVDGKVHFNRGGKFWTIANDIAPFLVSADNSWEFDTDKFHLNSAIPPDFTGAHAGKISQERAIAGWRWVQLSEPAGSYAGSGTAFVGGDAGNEVNRPLQQVLMHVDITRNRMGSTSDDYEFTPNDEEDGNVTLEIVNAISGGDADTVFGEPEYSLNMLLEYSNETVLMSQERGKPVHLSNLIAQGLPRQE